MKHDPTTGTWQDDTGCPISFVLAATSDADTVIVDIKSLYSHRPAAMLFVVDIESPCSHRPAAIMFLVDIESPPIPIAWRQYCRRGHCVPPCSQHLAAIKLLWTSILPISHRLAEILFVVDIGSPYSHHPVAILSSSTSSPPILSTRRQCCSLWTSSPSIPIAQRRYCRHRHRVPPYIPIAWQQCCLL